MKGAFPSIGSYGFISDCHTSALVSYTGQVEWLCLPRFDSPSVFGSILDREAGQFRLAPSGVVAPLSRRYEPGTLIVETTWFTDSGWLVSVDALTLPAAAEKRSQAKRMGTPRSGHESDRCLLRYIECIDGEADVDLECLPLPAYALGKASWETDGETGAIATLSAPNLDGEPHLTAGPTELRIAGNMRLTANEGRLTGAQHLKAGEAAFCALGWDADDHPLPSSLADAKARLTATRDFWRNWLRHGDFPDHPWRTHLQRSALVLKGLTYAPSGAIVAAPTTSLPEDPGGERNWDYRFSWIRDSSFALWALHSLGFSEEADDYIEFIAGICRDNPELQVMYGIGGERRLTEKTLDHLSGYEDSRPVRIGNGAFDQRQNDVWGGLMDAFYLHTKALDAIPDTIWPLVTHHVEAAAKAAGTPDQGMWESRGEAKHYVSSKLMIWVALDRGARMARQRAAHSPEQETDCKRLAEHWEARASELHAEICDRGVRGGVFRQHYDTDALDASTLLIPLVRFLPPSDPRVRDTVVAVARNLQANGLVLRYRTEETDDGLSGDEGAFMICSFWLVSALSEIGETHWARQLCERLLIAAGWLDLYAEEFDVASGRQLGNYPQAFTHLALINAVSHVIADERRLTLGDGATAVFSEMRGATIGG